MSVALEKLIVKYTNQNGEVVQEPTYDLKRNIPEFVGKYYRVNATKFSDEI